MYSCTHGERERERERGLKTGRERESAKCWNIKVRVSPQVARCKTTLVSRVPRVVSSLGGIGSGTLPELFCHMFCAGEGDQNTICYMWCFSLLGKLEHVQTRCGTCVVDRGKRIFTRGAPDSKEKTQPSHNMGRPQKTNNMHTTRFGIFGCAKMLPKP